LDTWQSNSIDGTDEARFLSLNPKEPIEFNVRFDFSLQFAPGKPYTIVTAPIADDRKLYEERREFASWWMGQMVQLGMPLVEEGLHLVWRGARTHVALTHRFQDNWMRKYSLILTNPCLSRPTEVVFTFSVRGDFRFFCSLTPVMDRIVESVNVTNVLSMTTTAQYPFWRRLLSIGPSRSPSSRTRTRSKSKMNNEQAIIANYTEAS
jgi:hypothetical protein